jgi:hypothetical protein
VHHGPVKGSLRWGHFRLPPHEQYSCGSGRRRRRAEALRCIIEDSGLTQSALVGPVLSRPGIVSEVLSSKRKLTLNHIKKLAEW